MYVGQEMHAHNASVAIVYTRTCVGTYKLIIKEIVLLVVGVLCMQTV